MCLECTSSVLNNSLLRATVCATEGLIILNPEPQYPNPEFPRPSTLPLPKTPNPKTHLKKKPSSMANGPKGRIYPLAHIHVAQERGGYYLSQMLQIAGDYLVIGVWASGLGLGFKAVWCLAFRARVCTYYLGSMAQSFNPPVVGRVGN